VVYRLAGRKREEGRGGLYSMALSLSLSILHGEERKRER